MSTVGKEYLNLKKTYGRLLLPSLIVLLLYVGQVETLTILVRRVAGNGANPNYSNCESCSFFLTLIPDTNEKQKQCSRFLYLLPMFKLAVLRSRSDPY